MVRVCCHDNVHTTSTEHAFFAYRGKGDYYRLGHSDDAHQRTPRRVMGALANEKVVDIDCGSLHCVVCTESGRVYAWGDNDEGQVGNDSTTAVTSPHVRTVCVCVCV